MSSAPGPPGPPDGDSARKRERIAEALLDLCFEHGYRSLSLQMLLDRAGVDDVGFRRHFDDLEDCFCQIYAGLRDELMESVRAAAAAQPSWRDGLWAAIYAIADFVEADERRTHLMGVDARSAGDRAVDLMEEGYQPFFDHLDRGREARPGGLTSRVTAEAIGGAIFFQMFSSSKADSAREKVPKLMYMAVLPYIGKEAAEEELRRPPAKWRRR